MTLSSSAGRSSPGSLFYGSRGNTCRGTAWRPAAHHRPPAGAMAAVASGNWPLWPEPGPQGWTCFPRVATRSLAMKPKPARAARDFAVATVKRWGAAGCADDVAIVVSELVTNALRHALPASGEA